MEIAKDKAMAEAELYARKKYKNDVTNISLLYPYSLYDFECREGYNTKYYLVFYTFDYIGAFSLSGYHHN